MRSLLQFGLRLLPLLTGVGLAMVTYRWVPDSAARLDSGMFFMLPVLAILVTGCYNVMNSIETTADRIKSTRNQFLNMRRLLRDREMRRATLRLLLLIAVGVLYFLVVYLLKNVLNETWGQYVSPVFIGIFAGVAMDAVLFYSLTRLQLSKIRERIDRENEQDQARLKLIEDLRQAREKEPLKPDPHLQSYISIHKQTA